MGKLVSVLLAIYNPRPEWLREQLASIDAQDYPHLEVCALDDCSEDPTTIIALFRQNLKRVPWRLVRGETNRGSNARFEELTGLARGEYVSYCDQDDIWEPHKTRMLVRKLEETGALLAYSELSVIDDEGRPLADRLTRLRKRLRYLEGEGLAEALLFRNFTNGTAMMARTETARSARPFNCGMFADHWLTLWAAHRGGIAHVPEPLVQYRLHGKNQSAMLARVDDKASYHRERIRLCRQRFDGYARRFAEDAALSAAIAEGIRWLDARDRWFRRWDPQAAAQVFRDRRLGREAAWFELLAARLPEGLFRLLIRLIQRGWF